MVFQIGSNYDYDFITKVLAKEFKGEFNCLGEMLISSNNKKKKKKKNIDGGRSMACSLLNLVDNLGDGIHKTKCKYGIKNIKCIELYIKIVSAALDTQTLKMIH